MPSLRIDALDLYYEVHGPAVPHTGLPPLLLVAGLATDSQSWAPVLPALAARRTVVVFDNRGCGRTTPQDAPSGIGRMADDGIALAERLGLGRFDLLGHSMGGFIALDCALRHPERLRRLILASTAAANPARNDLLFADWAADLAAIPVGSSDARARDAALTRWFRTFFYWIFTPGLFADPDTLAEWLRLSVAYPYPQSAAGFAAQTAALRGFDRRGALAQVAVPTLVLGGGADLLFPPGDDGAGLAAIPAARVQVLAGAAHGVYVQAPAAFTDAVVGFLDQ